MNSRNSPLRRPVLVAVAVSALVTLALALDLTPWLRGGAGWRWPYVAPEDISGLLPGLGVLALYLGMANVWLGRLEHSETPGIIRFGLFCALGGVALQLAFLSYYDPNPVRQLFMRTVSTSSGGFFEVGVRMDQPLDFLRAFPDLMPTLSVHPKAHPPGIPLLFWLQSRLFATLPPVANSVAAGLRLYQCHQTVIMRLPDAAIAGASLGMALPVLSMLALWPLYKLAYLHYDRPTALRAIAWWPLVPALVMFVPQWNQFHPIFALLALWLLARGLRSRRWQLFALSGLVMSAATFLSFTNVAILGMLGVYVVVWLAMNRESWAAEQRRKLALYLAIFIVGFFSLWVIYYLVAGVSFFTVLSISLGEHYGLGHPYLPWTLLLPMDFWLFGGLVLGVLAATQVARSWSRSDALALTLGISLLGLALSGVLRGEVGRLLLWLMPLVVIPAARATTGGQIEAEQQRATWAVSAVLSVQLIVMVAVLPVIGTELSQPPLSAPRGGTLSASRPADARFDRVASLVAFDGLPSADATTLDLRFIWQAQARMGHPQYAGVIVLDPNGEVVGVQDWLAGSELYPTSCWRPGELVGDGVRVPLDEMPPGDYWLSVRLFDAQSGDPMPVSVPGQPDDTQVGLGPISVP